MSVWSKPCYLSSAHITSTHHGTSFKRSFPVLSTHICTDRMHSPTTGASFSLSVTFACALYLNQSFVLEILPAEGTNCDRIVQKGGDRSLPVWGFLLPPSHVEPKSWAEVACAAAEAWSLYRSSRTHWTGSSLCPLSFHQMRSVSAGISMLVKRVFGQLDARRRKRVHYFITQLLHVTQWCFRNGLIWRDVE